MACICHRKRSCRAYTRTKTEFSPIQLNHWPLSAAISLTATIIKNANQSNYAVFGMDNTSYRYDLEEALLRYLENRGILTWQNLDPTLRVVDFKDTTDFTETLIVTAIASVSSITWFATRGSHRFGLAIRSEI
jgi:hypothetical protein